MEDKNYRRRQTGRQTIDRQEAQTDERAARQKDGRTDRHMDIQTHIDRQMDIQIYLNSNYLILY